MGIRAFFTVICAAAGIIAVNAETSDKSGEEYFYKSSVLFEAAGPVKEIKIDKTENPFPFIKGAKIAPDGKFEDSAVAMVYDGEGLLVGAECEVESGDLKGGFVKCEIEYDSAQLPKHIGVKSQLLFNGDFDFTYTYTEGRLRGVVVKSKVKKYDVISEYSFSGHEYDDHGNWVKRHVKYTTKVEGKYPMEADPTEYDEERTIIYYE